MLDPLDWYLKEDVETHVQLGEFVIVDILQSMRERLELQSVRHWASDALNQSSIMMSSELLHLHWTSSM